MKRLLILIISILFTVSLCACKKDLTQVGRQEASEDNTSNNIDKTSSYDTSSDNTYSISSHELVCEDDWIFEESYYYQDGTLYYASEKEGATDQIFTIHSYNIYDGSDTVLFTFTEEKYQGRYRANINTMSLNAEGDLIVYYRHTTIHEEDGMSYNEFQRRTYGMDGTCKNVVMLESDEDIGIDAICMTDTASNTYVSTGVGYEGPPQFYCYDNEGRKVYKIQIEDIFLSRGYVDSSDRLILLQSRIGQKKKWGYVDFAKGMLDFKELDGISVEDTLSIVGEYNDTLLIMGFEAMYSYDKTNKKIKKVMDYIKNGLSYNNIEYAAQIDADRYMCVNYPDTGRICQKEVIVYDKTSVKTEKAKLLVAELYYDDSEIRNFINMYNRNNDIYQIELINYGMDSEESNTQMMKDIMTGKVPDMYLVNNMDIDNLVAKGMLEDLTAYIDKDEVLNWDYFIDGYLDATKMDGKQYVMMKYFKLAAMAGKASELSAYKKDLSVGELMEYYKSKPAGTLLFADSSAMNIFSNILKTNENSYINWDTGKCEFDQEDFKVLLKFCYEFRNETISDNILDSWPRMIVDRDILFSNENIWQVSDIQVSRSIMQNDLRYIGYPSSNGKGVRLETEGSSLAISSVSENKDAVWDIIKELMTGNYARYTGEDIVGIPVSKSEFDMMVKDVTTTEKYTADDGREVEPQRYTSSHGGFNINIGPADDSDIYNLKELIGKARYCSKSGFVFDIISEDVDKYFNDQRNLEDTIDIIQDKMTKYVNESR